MSRGKHVSGANEESIERKANYCWWENKKSEVDTWKGEARLFKYSIDNYGLNLDLICLKKF